ncbi:MAG: hypothetical protein SGARI_004263, partial [Bacillariaceae sp.]
MTFFATSSSGLFKIFCSDGETEPLSCSAGVANGSGASFPLSGALAAGMVFFSGIDAVAEIDVTFFVAKRGFGCISSCLMETKAELQEGETDFVSWEMIGGSDSCIG